MVVLGYAEGLNQVIETNSDEYGSVLIKGTCYLTNENTISYESPFIIGTHAWLKLKGGFEVLLLTENGLKKLLGDDLSLVFHDHSQKKEDMYIKIICSHIGYSQKSSPNAKSTHTLETSNIGSSQMHSLQSSDLFLPNLGSSQVHSQQAPTLQRATGEFKVGDVTLDKSKPKSWKPEEVIIVLRDTNIGVGLSEKRIANIDIEGSDFENVVDALIRFEGKDEEKIEHACKQLTEISNGSVKLSIVRWMFQNLLEYE